jgi:hypothetical protein
LVQGEAMTTHIHNSVYQQLHSFILVIHKHEFKPVGNLFSTKGQSNEKETVILSAADVPIEFVCKLRKGTGKGTQLSKINMHSDRMFFFTGDSNEIKQIEKQGTDPKCCAYSAIIDVNYLAKEVMVYGSVVGLPPIFYCDLDDKFVITSDIHFLSNIPGFSFYFNVDSIREFVTIGYPIWNKTLFKNISMLPAGHTIKINGKCKSEIKRQWRLSEGDRITDSCAFMELQMTAFRNAMQGIDLSNSFLSLTAGMDTRSIFAALTSKNIKIPAYTLSGSTLSLDARTAKRLCNECRYDHKIIILNKRFFEQIANYSSEACRLSGGLASLTQAHEVFFYKEVDQAFNARLSGNLGNQVGRGGAENISLRDAGYATLSYDICHIDEKGKLSHWYFPYLRSGGHLAYDFLLENEIPFSSVGNYAIGNNFAIQQSPYADSNLIEISKNRPYTTEDNKNTSLMKMRIKDLRHRFLGESIDTSFQRKYIKQVGGAVAEIPINWGGKAKGGLSILGLGHGLMALADAALVSKGIDSGVIYNAASMMRIPGMHEYRHYSKWLKKYMKDFSLDLFSSKSTIESGLFNLSKLEKNASLYFSQKVDTHKHLTLEIDLALAARVFNASLS